MHSPTIHTTELWTDGSTGPGGTGGWAFICQHGPNCAEHAGHEHGTTSQRMELTALIMAMAYCLERRLPRPTIYSDSEYGVKIFTIWARRWTADHWRKKKNTDLVKMGLDLYHRLTPRLQWVRGHNGNAGNERADKLAGLAAVNRQPSSCWYEPSISLRNEEQRELVLAAPEADVEGKLTEDDIRWEKAELVRLEKRLLEDCSAVGSSVKAAYVIAETGAFWTSIHRELSEKARMKHGVEAASLRRKAQIAASYL